MSGLTPAHRVFYGGTRQCTPLLERLAPAKAAGHTSLSVWPGDLRGLDRAEVARRIAEAGLVVSEVEIIGSWIPQHNSADSPFGEFLSAMTPERVCPVAVELGASTVSTAELFGLAFDGREMAKHFGEMCDKAAAHGLRVALEFVPTGGVPGLAEAWEIIDRAGRANGGLMMDSWHFFRSNSSLDALARIPGDRIFSIQLNDARAEPEADLNIGMMNRLLPGDGGLDLAGFMQALAATGTSAFIGVETFSRALDALPTEEAAQACSDGIDYCLRLAGEAA